MIKENVIVLSNFFFLLVYSVYVPFFLHIIALIKKTKKKQTNAMFGTRKILKKENSEKKWKKNKK